MKQHYKTKLEVAEQGFPALSTTASCQSREICKDLSLRRRLDDYGRRGRNVTPTRPNQGVQQLSNKHFRTTKERKCAKKLTKSKIHSFGTYLRRQVFRCVLAAVLRTGDQLWTRQGSWLCAVWVSWKMQTRNGNITPHNHEVVTAWQGRTPRKGTPRKGRPGQRTSPREAVKSHDDRGTEERENCHQAAQRPCRRHRGAVRRYDV